MDVTRDLKQENIKSIFLTSLFTKKNEPRLPVTGHLSRKY